MKKFLLLSFCSFGIVSSASAQSYPYYLQLSETALTCCVATDANGNVYVAALLPRPSTQIFSGVSITKLDRNNNVVYAFSFGTDSGAIPNAIAVDQLGNLIAVGSTRASGFPLVNPVITNGGGFIGKLNATGTGFVFSTLLGDSVNAVALDASGNIFVTGETVPADFPVTSDAFQPSISNCSGSYCATYSFIAKLSSSGDQILYSGLLGGSAVSCFGTPSQCLNSPGRPDTVGNAIAVAGDGTITVAGYTDAFDFPSTPGAFQQDCDCRVGSPDFAAVAGFVTRFRLDGKALLWSTFLGGGAGGGGAFGGASISRLALLADGTVIVAGTTGPNFKVTTGAFQTNFASTISGFGPRSSGFITKFNSSGTGLVFSTYLGGQLPDTISDLQVDSLGKVWVTGITQSADFPVLPNGLKLGNSYVDELSADGTTVLQSTMFPNYAAGQALVLDTLGNTILLGPTGSVLRVPGGRPTGSAVFGVANAAGYSVSGSVAPGEIISIYGIGLGPKPGVGARLESDGKIATSLANVQVLFDGLPAPLLYAGENQINAIVPFEVSGRASTAMQLANSAGGSSSQNLALGIVATSPEIFTSFSPASSLPNSPFLAAALNEDGTLNSKANPANPGSIVTFWANGAGLFTSSLIDGSIVGSSLPKPLLPVSVFFDIPSQTLPSVFPSLEILYAGAAPGMAAGIIQVNARLPQTIRPGNAIPGTHALRLLIGDNLSGYVGIAVQNGTSQ